MAAEVHNVSNSVFVKKTYINHYDTKLSQLIHLLHTAFNDCSNVRQSRNAVKHTAINSSVDCCQVAQ